MALLVPVVSKFRYPIDCRRGPDREHVPILLYSLNSSKVISKFYEVLDFQLVNL